MRKRIGSVFVDAGLIWVGDPCYVMGEDSSHGVKAWKDFCDKLTYDKGEQFWEPLGRGVGLAVSSGIGDGEYPVYIETKDLGTWGERVSSITIEFLEEEGDEDE